MRSRAAGAQHEPPRPACRAACRAARRAPAEPPGSLQASRGGRAPNRGRRGPAGVLVSPLVVGQAVTMAMTEPGLTERGLSEREKSIIDFERTWWTLEGTKEELIRSHFD